MSLYQPASLVALLQQEAIDRIESVERQMERAVKERIESMPIARHDTLTPRELQVVLGMIAGEDVDGTAARMKLHRNTVQTYQQRAKEKLGLTNTRDLVSYVFKIAFQRSN